MIITGAENAFIMGFQCGEFLPFGTLEGSNVTVRLRAFETILKHQTNKKVEWLLGFVRKNSVWHDPKKCTT